MKNANDLHQPSYMPPTGLRGTLSNVAAPLFLVIVAVVIAMVLLNSPPDVPKSKRRGLAPVVGVAELISHEASVFVDAYGTVVPSQDIRIIPEVTGRIVELNSHLEQGGLIASGDLLVKIDPTDYDIAVAQAQADLEFAEHEVARIHARIESLRGRGRQIDVEIENLKWNADRLGTLAERNSAAESEARDAKTKLDSQRAARQTLEAEIAEQRRAVESAVATVRVAQRRLEAANLELQRTVVRAPFDALVLTENVEKGQLVGPQTSMARMIATDEFWIEAAIPIARLPDVRFAIDHGENASRVTVRLAAGGDALIREGIALRPLGDLEPLGRMARVLVSIKDPLLRHGTEREAGPRVLLGTYVRLQIESGTIEGVYAIPRKALRENDRIWVRDANGKLAIRPVSIVWRRYDDVLVRDGLKPGDQLVTTHLASVVPGMPLRVRPDSPESAIASSPTPEPSQPEVDGEAVADEPNGTRQ
ncbi:MAG: efflux RND transporter periplasmic adaptor subunit [Planctomycetota bacterium]|jgi:multidrug efflux pump subunit AcrA (membrane-fusion protein)